MTLSHITFFSTKFNVMYLVKYVKFINHRYRHLIFEIGEDKIQFQHYILNPKLLSIS